MTATRITILVLAGLGAVVASASVGLAATGAGDDAPRQVQRGTISLEQAAPPKAAPRTQSGNPLWAIPLATLTNTRQRPLFSPSRRPPAPPPVAAVPRVQPPKPIVAPPVAEHPRLVLIGTVIGENESVGVFLDQTSNRVVRLRTGEGHGGWILRSLEARQATLAKDQQTETLNLPSAQGGPR